MGVRDTPSRYRGKGRSIGNTKEWIIKAHSSQGTIGANGLKDVWVIGETFFRGVGVVFDVKEKMVGFRAF